MTESVDGTHFSKDSDPPIIDLHGVDWKLDPESGLVSRGGILQHGISHVDELVYQGQQVWAHRSIDQSWYVFHWNGRWLLTAPTGDQPNKAAQHDAATLGAMIAKVQHTIVEGFQAAGAGKTQIDGKLDKLEWSLGLVADSTDQGFGSLTKAVDATAPKIDAITSRTQELLQLQCALEQQIAALTSVTDAIHRHVHNLPDTLSTLASGLEVVQQGIAQLLDCQPPQPDMQAASVRFVVPYCLDLKTRERIAMAVNIKDDVISVIPIEFDNVGGSAVPAPSGGTASVSVDNAAFSVELSADGSSVEVTPAQPPQDGQVGVITYSDVVNGVTFTATLPDVTISLDSDAVSVHFRTDAITTKPLPAAAPPVTPPDPGAPAAPTP